MFIKKLKEKKLTLILATLVIGTVAILWIAIPPNDSLAASLLGGKVFGGKVESISPAGPTCPLKMIKVGKPVELDKGIIFDPTELEEGAGGILGKIPGLGDIIKQIKKIVKKLAPTKIYEIGGVGLSEWAIGTTWPKTITKPVFESLKAVGIVCDSDAYVIRIIGTSAL